MQQVNADRLGHVRPLLGPRPDRASTSRCGCSGCSTAPASSRRWSPTTAWAARRRGGDRRRPACSTTPACRSTAPTTRQSQPVPGRRPAAALLEGIYDEPELTVIVLRGAARRDRPPPPRRPDHPRGRDRARGRRPRPGQRPLARAVRDAPPEHPLAVRRRDRRGQDRARRGARRADRDRDEQLRRASSRSTSCWPPSCAARASRSTSRWWREIEAEHEKRLVPVFSHLAGAISRSAPAATRGQRGQRGSTSRRARAGHERCSRRWPLAAIVVAALAPAQAGQQPSRSASATRRRLVRDDATLGELRLARPPAFERGRDEIAESATAARSGASDSFRRPAAGRVARRGGPTAGHAAAPLPQARAASALRAARLDQRSVSATSASSGQLARARRSARSRARARPCRSGAGARSCCSSSSTISSHCAIQPDVRGIANITVNIVGRDAQRLVDQARVEVDVRVELALGEVLVVERALLELDGDVELRVACP